MELFEKIYGCYYQVVRKILTEASDHPITKKQMEDMSAQYGYQESALTIVPKLTGGGWTLLSQDGKDAWNSLVPHPPMEPLTSLQKAWIKSILSDQRICLFLEEKELKELELAFSDVEPLFSFENFHYYDRYQDGDAYDDSGYQERFRTILQAISEEKQLLITYSGKQNAEICYEAAPYQLQYSSKDDKFRLCCRWRGHRGFGRELVLNLGRMKTCQLSEHGIPPGLEKRRFQPSQKSTEPVVIEISGERNSLERCMLHFASYEKHTEYQEESHTYLCSIYYDMADETELLIEILSFGPVIRVLGPESFVRQIRGRVKKQHDLFYKQTKY